MTLYEISRSILLLNHGPISKIRLARMIYFTHKDLVRKKFMQLDEIAYIRSPLGPIPEGFLALPQEHPGIISQRNTKTNLAYASEEYAVPSNDIDAETSTLEQYRDVLSAIERVLKALHGIPTPELIRASHRDPSWIAHNNGDVYYITAADLKNTFPFSTLPTIRIKIRFSRPPAGQNNEIGALQANLLRGMITDIVKESTDLEYPNDPKTAAKPPKSKREASKKHE